MSNHIESTNEDASVIGRERNPQDAQRTIADASRLVIRDKSSQETSQTDEKFDFSNEQSERVTFVSGRNNTATLQFHPVPNESTSQSIAHIDWLGFTLVPPKGKALDWLFQELRNAFDLCVTEVKNAGWNGYTHHAVLGRFGIVAWGGKAQRSTIHVEINGTGCAHIKDWISIEDWSRQQFARITRIDLAHDDLDGSKCNIERTLEWREAGGFNCGGRNSKIKLAGDWHDFTDGRTIYIGTRGNKMLRCYEKGKQLDDPNSPWFRIELELRNKNRVLPWDMLTRPGQYLAGAYPCLAFLSTEQNKLKTTQRATAISLDCMTTNAARLSGKAVNVLMQLHHEDANAVVDLLRRNGIPKRLEPYEDNLRSMADKEINP